MLKVKDKVKVSLKAIDWTIAHINEVYKVPSANEVADKHLPEIASLLDCHLTRKSPKGVIVSKGFHDPVQQNFKVKLKLKYCTLESYFEEKDLKKLVK